MKVSAIQKTAVPIRPYDIMLKALYLLSQSMRPPFSSL